MRRRRTHSCVAEQVLESTQAVNLDLELRRGKTVPAAARTIAAACPCPPLWSLASARFVRTQNAHFAMAISSRVHSYTFTGDSAMNDFCDKVLVIQAFLHCTHVFSQCADIKKTYKQMPARFFMCRAQLIKRIYSPAWAVRKSDFSSEEKKS